MRFVCEKCKTKYTIADERVRRKILKIRCKGCSSIIVIREAPGDQTVKAVVDAGRKDAKRAAASRARAGTGSSRVSRAAMGQEQRQARTAFPLEVQAAPLHYDQPDPADATLLDEDFKPDSARFSGAADFLDDSAVGEGEWYLAVEGNQYGPMNLNELCSRVRRGETGDEAYVWRDGFDDWVDVQDLPELKPFLPRHPPPPPKGKSGLFVVGGPPSQAVSAPPFPEIPTPSGSGLFPGRPTPATPLRQVAPAAQLPPTSQATALPMPAMTQEGSGLRPMPQLVQIATDGSSVAPAPSPLTKTPTWMIVAGVGGGLAAICGIFLVIYSVFFDRQPAEAIGAVASTAAASDRSAAVAMDNTATAEMSRASDAGMAIVFPPIEVERSKKRDRRGRQSRDKAIARLGRLGRRQQAAKERLLGSMPPSLPDRKETASDRLSTGHRAHSSQISRDHVPRMERRINRRRITGEEIIALQKRNRQSLHTCYTRALKRDESLVDLKADVTVTIHDDGSVSEVEVEVGESADLAGCIQRVIKRWQFPIIGEQSFGFPIFFKGS